VEGERQKKRQRKRGGGPLFLKLVLHASLLRPLTDGPKKAEGYFVSNMPFSSVPEPHHFYAAPAPCKNFDAAPAAPAPTLYRKTK
jgi:hypothetical protein